MWVEELHRHEKESLKNNARIRKNKEQQFLIGLKTPNFHKHILKWSFIHNNLYFISIPNIQCLTDGRTDGRNL